MLALPFLTALALGLLLVRCILPDLPTRPRWGGPVLDVSLGMGLGMGLTSSLYFILLWIGIARFQLAFEGAAIAAAAFWFIRQRGRRGVLEGEELPSFPWTWLLLLLLGACFAFFVASFALAASANPQGEWDAFAIWNLRARFLAAGPDGWRGAFSPLLSMTHPDYPLLLSGFVARCWTMTGEITSAAPLATALVFPVCVFGVLFGTLALGRSLTTGLLAVLVLFATGSFTGQASAQYADLPLSYFFLASLALLWLAQRFPQSPALALAAGAAAGMAAWTKNEGIPFLVLAFIAAFLFLGRSAAVRFALGAAPFALITAAFKLFLAPGLEPLFRQGPASIGAKIVDPGRYFQILGTFVTNTLEVGFPATHPLLAFGLLALFLRFRGRDQLRALRLLALPVAGMFAVYFGAFLFSTDALKWHLDTASQRLFMQIWPGLILLGMLALQRPEDHAVAVEAPRKKAKARA